MTRTAPALPSLLRRAALLLALAAYYAGYLHGYANASDDVEGSR